MAHKVLFESEFCMRAGISRNLLDLNSHASPTTRDGHGYAANAHEFAWAMQKVETSFTSTQAAWFLVLQRHCRLSCGSFPLEEESNALIGRCPYII
jgi:hypothetical protein